MSTVAPLYVFSNADSGTTATVPVGASIEIEVLGCPGTTWAPVFSSAPKVVDPISSSVGATAGSDIATLSAQSAGESILSVRALSACPAVVAPFHMTVVVS